jgi:hypothetical protein
MRLGELAEATGKGFFAGVAGTAAISASMAVEAKLRNKELGPVQAEAVEKVAGVAPKGEEEKERLANLVHWQYGAAWGALRGVISLLPLSPPTATAVHFGLVWGAAGTLLPTLKLAPPPTKQPPAEVALNTLHHLLYAAVTSAAFEFLDAQ